MKFYAKLNKYFCRSKLIVVFVQKYQTIIILVLGCIKLYIDSKCV